MKVLFLNIIASFKSSLEVGHWIFTAPPLEPVLETSTPLLSKVQEVKEGVEPSLAIIAPPPSLYVVLLFLKIQSINCTSDPLLRKIAPAPGQFSARPF